jgi:hypothetical protein
VAAVVGDLATWPLWLDVVRRAVPAGADAWAVRLGLRLGPLEVGRDLRMKRVGPLRFERDEPGHSAVVIDVDLRPARDAEVELTLVLRIEKRIPLVDLGRELRRRAGEATGRLQALVDQAQAEAGP